MRFNKKLLLFLIIPLFAFSVHKYYISLTKIDFKASKKSVQITMRFFIDDIENTLQSRYNIPFELATKQENKKSDFYLEKYIKQRFKIHINGEEKLSNYLGKEYENDVVYFYLEINGIEQINQFQVQNNMLMETFEDQENYIKLDINNLKKTFILIKANDKEMLKF
ncbi:MAG: peptidase E [Flavobacteriaceae bacterium]|nr:peptidase E [Flavobacteriaceae bacterium]